MAKSRKPHLKPQRGGDVTAIFTDIVNSTKLPGEAKTGRIFVHLDVTDPEPPLPEEPLRKLHKVVMTPHISGSGTYGYHKIGESAVRALEGFFNERPVQGSVDLSAWDRIP